MSIQSSIDATWGALLRQRKIDALTLGLALCAAPLSIAIAESLLVIALVAHIARLVRHRARPCFPRVFWFWLVWAGLEVLLWLHSANRNAGWGEVRHLLLLAALFLVLPALDQPLYKLDVWRWIFLSATLSSTVLIGQVMWRLFYYRRVISTFPDPSFYLRSGGLLHHWMIYGTVEVLVFAGLLEFWHLYPEDRRRLWPVLGLNGLAIILSLTRMLWVCCFMLLAVHLLWRRSKWIWALPLLPLALFFLAPGVVRSRVTDSFKPDYYSNAERVQMLRVGWKMILDKPWTGVGPGRVEGLYRGYLSAGDPVPAYHGHLHNNLVQLAAEFGLPVVVAAILFVAVLFRDLMTRCRSASGRESEFLCRTAVLGLIGFLVSGMFDYTYGHSLGLIMLSFVVLSPLVPRDRVAWLPYREGQRRTSMTPWRGSVG